MRWSPLCVLLPSVAFAAPLRLTHQGRLLDASDVPVTGAHTVTVRLYGQASGGAAVFTETDAVTFDAGYFATVLGDGATLDLDTLGADLWVAVALDGGADIGERQPLTSVPFALRAAALDGPADVPSLSIDGTLALDASGAHGIPGTLSGTTCADGQVLRAQAGGWACADDRVLTGAEVRGAVGAATVALAAGSTVGGAAISSLSTAAVRADLESSAVALADGSTVGGVAVATLADVPDTSSLLGSLAGEAVELGEGSTLAGAPIASLADLDGFTLADQTCAVGRTVTGVDAAGVLTCAPLRLTGGLSCGTGDDGRLQYVDGAVQVCDGNGWVDLGGSTASAVCHDGAQGPDETGIDCGGPCGPCAVAHWTLDGTAVEAGGRYDGIAHGTVGAPDRFGAANGALAFDGASAWVEVPHAAGLQLSSVVTVAVWVHRTVADHLEVLVEKGGDWTRGGTNYGVGLHTSGNNHMFYMYWAGGWRAVDGPADLAWHHLVSTAVEGSATGRFWIDGVEKTQQYAAGASTIHLGTTTDALAIGAQRDSGLDYFASAVIDDVRIWGRELTQPEIDALYADGPP